MLQRFIICRLTWWLSVLLLLYSSKESCRISKQLLKRTSVYVKVHDFRMQSISSMMLPINCHNSYGRNCKANICHDSKFCRLTMHEIWCYICDYVHLVCDVNILSDLSQCVCVHVWERDKIKRGCYRSVHAWVYLKMSKRRTLYTSKQIILIQIVCMQYPNSNVSNKRFLMNCCCRRFHFNGRKNTNKIYRSERRIIHKRIITISVTAHTQKTGFRCTKNEYIWI